MLATESIAGFEGDGVLSDTKDIPTSVSARLSRRDCLSSERLKLWSQSSSLNTCTAVS